MLLLWEFSTLQKAARFADHCAFKPWGILTESPFFLHSKEDCSVFPVFEGKMVLVGELLHNLL